MNFYNHTILAPLTKGGNLPYRRLCVEYGATMTISEMAYARNIVKGEGREMALLRHHPSETNFGVQMAARQIDEATKAAKIIADKGAHFIDLNCGCPIHDTTRRGLGANLLTRPKNLGELVAALVKSVQIPITVKIRIGWSDDDINVHEVSKIIEEAGASAITVHGRTREQRYSKPANWDLIGEIVAARKIPVIGNGDILTHYEAKARQDKSNCASIMIGRGALIKPWIFQELKENRDIEYTSEERVAVYWKLAQYMKEHFRDDEKGKKRALFFLPWHFTLFSRFQNLPRDKFEALSKEWPLIQTRAENSDTSLLGQVLSSGNELIHSQIAQILWESPSPMQATARLQDIKIVAEERQLEQQGEEVQG